MPTRYLPFLAWIPELNKSNVRADALAGFTGAVVALPQGVAFATIAGMPPEYGLYAAMIPAIVAALFGSSRLLVSGPTTAASIVLFSTLSQFATPGSEEYVRLALTLTLMVGVVQVVLGLARFGALVNFISHSVVVGFTAGAGVLIAASQIKHFLGIEMPAGLSFYEIALHLVANARQIDPLTTTVGVVTLVVGVVSRKYWPRVPYMLVALVVGSLVALFINGFRTGADVPVALTGAVPQTLPPLSSPDFSLETLKQLAPATLAVTLFALTEAVSIARSLASRTGDLIDGNQEFIGQDLSNVVGSFFSSYIATGSFNRSAVNYEAGARTPLAAVLAGSLLIVLVLLVAPLLAYLPKIWDGGCAVPGCRRDYQSPGVQEDTARESCGCRCFGGDLYVDAAV